MVEAAATRWDLEIGPPFEPGGVTSWVAPASTVSGVDVVLKIVVPHEEAAAEAAGLTAWDGTGAVRLLGHDADSWTLLLERLGPGDLEAAGPTVWLPAMLDLLADLWSAPVPDGVPSVADIVAPWPGLMRSRPKAAHWDAAVVDLAIEILDGWPGGVTDPVLMHGDLHPENVMARDGEWVSIDPKPMVGDRAFDLRQVIRAVVDPNDPRPAGPLADIVAATGVDRDRALGWTLAVQVESAIWALPHDPAEAEEDYRLAAACADLLG